MYYNAKGDIASYESIGRAVSDDMVEGKRNGENPVITKGKVFVVMHRLQSLMAFTSCSILVHFGKKVHLNDLHVLMT